MPIDYSRVPTRRLLSWQHEHEQVIAHKAEVMARHAEGTAYHTRARLEMETRQSRLTLILEELQKRGI